MATNWNELMEEHEIAYLRADICLGSPQSYSLEEKSESARIWMQAPKR